MLSFLRLGFGNGVFPSNFVRISGVAQSVLQLDTGPITKG
jgi:hypothetical protein